MAWRQLGIWSKPFECRVLEKKYFLMKLFNYLCKMLIELAKNHAVWKQMAFSICKDKYLADDIVSEMYLKLSNLEKDINNGYVYRTLKSVYIDWLRANKPLDEIPTELAAPEQQLYGEEVVMPSTLSWLEVQIITLRQDHSLRKIATAYGMNYLKVYRAEKQARKKVELWQRKN